MNDERRDGMIDALLSEAVGGTTPPDLSDRILAACLARQNAPAATAAQPPVPVAPRPVVLAPPAVPAPVSVPAARNGAVRPAPVAQPARADSESVATTIKSRRRRGRWAMALAATLLIGVGVVAATQVDWGKFAGSGDGSPQDRTAAGSPDDGPSKFDEQVARARAARLAQEREAARRASEERPDAGPPVIVTGPGGTDRPATDTVPDVPESDLASAETPDSGSSETVAAQSSSSDAEVVAYIDELIRRGWEEAGVVGSPAATDGEWVRRIYLDLLGRIPTAEESARFALDRSRGKRAELVSRLLDSDEYAEEFARNWTTIWTNLLIGRSGGTQQGSLVNRDGLQQYLRRSFLRNKPYDQMVFELVSADGANTPGQEGYNGAVNFLLDNLNENAAPATAKTARLFLGLQVQCTQCHNHPFNDWKQDQFWTLNAFFRQTTSRQETRDQAAVALLGDADFGGEAGSTGIEEAAVFYEQRNGLMKSALPRFVDGEAISSDGRLAVVNRRDELARLIVESDYLSRAIVNRVWAHLLGYGFTKPVDDMGPHNPASHPELLDRLAEDFRTHGHDLRQLIRWIALSEAYSLSSRVVPKRNDRDDPALGERPLFTHFYLRQMRPEELYNSLLVATSAQQAGGGDYAAVEQRKAQWLQQFTIAFGTDENDETTTFNGTIPQTLMMWNGELIATATSGQPGTFLHAVATADEKNAAKLNQLFLTALSRRPTRAEINAANVMFQYRGGDTMAALQDVWWVVLNSNEFIFNH
jgi:hypothetical protein